MTPRKLKVNLAKASGDYKSSRSVYKIDTVVFYLVTLNLQSDRQSFCTVYTR